MKVTETEQSKDLPIRHTHHILPLPGQAARLRCQRNFAVIFTKQLFRTYYYVKHYYTTIVNGHLNTVWLAKILKATKFINIDSRYPV